VLVGCQERLMHQARSNQANQIVSPKTGAAPSPGLAHKTVGLQCTETTLCNSEKCVK
jgi:hypothetical protein